MDELLHEEVVDAAWVVLHLVGKGGHLLRAPAVNGREVFFRVGVAVVFQFQLRVRRDDGQLLQVLFGRAGRRRCSADGGLFVLCVSFCFRSSRLRSSSDRIMLYARGSFGQAVVAGTSRCLPVSPTV